MQIVNGYVCYNCTDVDNAKKYIDPAHPKDGPFGASATGKANGKDAAKASNLRPDAVTFGGALSALNTPDNQNGSGTPPVAHALDISA